MAYRLTTLGELSLSDGAGHPVKIPGPALVMCACLREIGRPVARRDLARLLWPGSHETAASSLRSTLLRVGAATAAADIPILIVRPSTVELNQIHVWCDLDLIRDGEQESKLAVLHDGVARKFLPAYGEGSTPLAAFVRDVRARLARELRDTFLTVAGSQRASALRGELKRAAILLLELDPDDEDVRRALAAVAPSFSVRLAPASAGSHLPEWPTIIKPDPAPPRIALLPPESLHAAQGAGSIANALIEDLTIELCANRNVSVVAPYTATKIQAARNKAAILEEHHVIYVLDTKRRDQELFAQLIFMPRDEVVWAARLSLDESCVAEQRSIMRRAIEQAFMAQIMNLAPSVQDFRLRPRAYYAYLEGLRSLTHATLPDVRRARKHFMGALDHDRNFAAALSGLSRTLNLEWVLTAQGDRDLLARAESLAARAINTDPHFAGGYKELGVTELYLGKIDESLAAHEQAVKVSPHYADVLCGHADSLSHAGRAQEAHDKIHAALTLNPLAPDTYFWTAAGASFFLQEFGQALHYIEQMKDKRPAARLAAACWSLLGDSTKAKACRLKVMSDIPDFDLERWLSMVPLKEKWQTDLYREGLRKAGF